MSVELMVPEYPRLDAAAVISGIDKNGLLNVTLVLLYRVSPRYEIG